MNLKPRFFIAFTLIAFSLLYACESPLKEEYQPYVEEPTHEIEVIEDGAPVLVVLGTVQDAGSPQIGCTKDCCKDLHINPDPNRMVVSLGLIDPAEKQHYLFEATPDIVQQLSLLNMYAGTPNDQLPNGTFLTHAHIGHYTGLMYYGKEAISAEKALVFAMPKMTEFLLSNGPWNQLVRDSNIVLMPTACDEEAWVKLSEELYVQPILVPHRDEFSETVGYVIKGPNKKALFIPDINKWEVWEESIAEWIGKVDYALLDATFYDDDELSNRDMSEIPHPFVVESMQAFDLLEKEEKAKVHFIHFNHTNPLLNKDSKQFKLAEEKGFNVAELGDVFRL